MPCSNASTFPGYLPQCGQEHIPHTEFQKVDDWMRHHIAEYLEPICTPYFVPMTDGMIVLINITGLHIDSLDESSRENVRAICQGLEHAIEALKSHGLICGAVVSTVFQGRENIVKAYKEAQELTAYADLMGEQQPRKERPMTTPKLHRAQ